MGVFSNVEIDQALDTGHIVIEPLVRENIRQASVDVTLGEWFYFCGRSHAGVYNPFDEKAVERYFGEPQQARPMSDWRMKLWYGEHDLAGIPEDHPIIWLPARSRILAHSHEFIGINPPGTSELRARSSWGRNGISVCLCAGWGDPGYINRWTWEIHNFNPVAVPLPAGERMGQVIFHRTGMVAGGTYGREKTYESKYQNSDDVVEIIKAWTPESMLPRSYKDERRLPMPINVDEIQARFEEDLIRP